MHARVCGPSTISLESCRGDTPRGYRTQCQPVAESLHECNESHACNQHEESQVSAPHGVVSNTPLRVVHKSLKRNVDRHGSGKAPAVRRHMTLDVAGVAAALLSTSRHSEKTEGRCQVLVTNVAINIVRTYEDCDCFAS